MADFNPSPRDQFTIAGTNFEVMPHPSVPAFAFGQEGRKAFVYQVRRQTDDALFALKKFKLAFRVPELVEVCDSLARFAKWDGLEAAARICLNQPTHPHALNDFPDLEYAVLMPWIIGSTWYDIVVAMTPLNKREAVAFANGVARVLDGVEEAGLAHCDIAAPNVIVNPATGSAHLIDIEDIYAPGFAPPSALPAGTEGYAHKTAFDGIWEPAADRFAGAVLMVEMAAWFNADIRKQAEEEHYFSADEMQDDSPRYQLMHSVLQHDLSQKVADLFEQAWFSETLEDCPPLREWHHAFEEVFHQTRLEDVVSNWQPLTIGTQTQPDSQHAPEESTESPEQEISETAPANLAEEPALQHVDDEEDRVEEPAEEPETIASSMPVSRPKVTSLPSFQSTTPMPPPAAPAPIFVQQSNNLEDNPVVEWRPLVVPPARSPVVQQKSEVAADDVTVIEAEQHAPFEVEQLDQENQPESDLDTSVSLDSDVLDISEPAAENVYDEESGLIKPLLDLSHVDGRGRPYLVWTESPGATYYLLQESQDDRFIAPKEFRLKADTTHWNPRRKRSGRYLYRVRAIDNYSDESDWSDTLTIRIGDE